LAWKAVEAAGKAQPCVGGFFPILPVFNPSLEFRMGYRFTSSTWRAPIQLIDSWLPAPAFSEPPRKASRVVQLFTRAGWLSRPAAHAPDSEPAAAAHPAAPMALAASRPCHVRILRTPETSGSCRPDARLVISGRINDVCAELDRLASLEFRQKQPN
jgi:hypothetical protein